MPLRYCSQILIVRSSGTSLPLEENSQTVRPMGDCRSSERKISPVEEWKKPGIAPRILPCVPLPLPGAPNRRIVLYRLVMDTASHRYGMIMNEDTPEARPRFRPRQA